MNKKISENPFFKEGKNQVPIAEYSEGIVQKRKKGRPKKPDTKPYLFRLNEGLHQKLITAAKRNYQDKSAYLTKILVEVLGKEY